MQRVILTERTPNPDALKFLAGTVLLDAGVAEFDSPQAAAGSPLASRLFALGGVERVFIARDFVSVTRTAEVGWPALGPAVQAAVAAHLESGDPAVDAADESLARSSVPGSQAAVARVLAEIEPYVAGHGGGIELLDYRDGVVELRLRGACVGCQRATETLRDGIERRLRAAIPELLEVRAR